MIYEKDGVRLTNNNPVCSSLFIKQGWTPVEDELEANEKLASDTVSPQDKPANKRTAKSTK